MRRSTRSRPDQIDAPADARAARFASGREGVVSIEQLRACGLDDDAVAARVRNGWPHRIHRGVYAVGHRGISLRGRFRAAVLACAGGSALGRFSAAAEWGFVPWKEREVEVVTRGGPRRVPGVRVYRSRSLDRRDVRWRDGIPRCKGHRGAAKLRAVVADGPAPTRSTFEDTLLDLLDAAGIPRPEINAPLRLGGRTIIPDYLWRDRRLAIEADSTTWHDHKLTRENDADKQAILEARGWRVLRVSYDRARLHPKQTLARIGAALDATATR